MADRVKRRRIDRGSYFLETPHGDVLVTRRFDRDGREDGWAIYYPGQTEPGDVSNTLRGAAEWVDHWARTASPTAQDRGAVS